MSDRPDMSKVTRYPPLRKFIEDGYGSDFHINDPGDGSPITGSMRISFEEMEAMGPEGRAKYDLEKVYQFAVGVRKQRATDLYLHSPPSPFPPSHVMVSTNGL